MEVLCHDRSCPCCEGGKQIFQRDMGNDRILECLGCGAAYSARIPNDEELSATYARLYAASGGYQLYREQIAQIKRSLSSSSPLQVGWERKRFFASVKPGPGGTLLDVGCGIGFFLVAAHQMGWVVSGVELSGDAVELGRTVHNHSVHVGRVELAPFPLNSFKAVTAWEVVEHLPHPLEFLEQVKSLLQPGGIFAGSVPNYARSQYRFGTDLGIASVPPVHLNFWTPQSLAKLLTHAGFQDVNVYSPHFCPDLLKPPRSVTPARFLRFLKVWMGLDSATSIYFSARKP